MYGKRSIVVALALLILLSVITSGAVAGFEHHYIVETDVPLEEN